MKPLASQPRQNRALLHRALLVDSDDDTRDLYKTFLSARRYAIEEASNGPQALAKAISDPPDILVTEITLPGFDGYSLCELLRNDPATKSIPIVVLTADARMFNHQRALAAGADVVLVKPCPPDALIAALDDVRANTAAVRGGSSRLLTSVRDGSQRPPGPSARAGNQKTRLSQAVERYATTTPPLAVPALACPACFQHQLEYRRSFVGGVSARFTEQWDELVCPGGCGEFQYRHRTRRVTHKPE